MRDHTKACRMGYHLPLDRCPSDNDSRVAFTIGVWAKGMALAEPRRLVSWTHPLLGEHWRLELPGGGERFLQAWPHPSNPQQTLLVPAPGVVDG